MTIFGNELSRRAVGTALLAPPRFLTLSGPEHLGKFSFVRELLESRLDESDLLVADVGPDGARQARSFLADRPSFSPFRAVLINDIDFLSEPAQDSWLKLCEEAPEGSCVIAVSSDLSFLLPPLLSRVVKDVRWFPLGVDEMAGFAAVPPGGGDGPGRDVDQFALSAASGRPGLYDVMRSPGYLILYESVCSSVSSPSFELPVPSAVKDLESGRSLERTAASMVVRRAALSAVADLPRREAALSFLRFAGDIVRVPSANAEIHWRNAVISSLKL